MCFSKTKCYLGYERLSDPNKALGLYSCLKYNVNIYHFRKKTIYIETTKTKRTKTGSKNALCRKYTKPEVITWQNLRPGRNCINSHEDINYIKCNNTFFHKLKLKLIRKTVLKTDAFLVYFESEKANAWLFESSLFTEVLTSETEVEKRPPSQL